MAARPSTKSGAATKTKARRPSRRRSASTWTSRAVTRAIEAGAAAECAWCGERVKFQARVKAEQVICNVYVAGRWDRVEHYHLACYHAAGEPHGETSSLRRP